MEHSVGLILVASTRGASRAALLEGVKQAQTEIAPELQGQSEGQPSVVRHIEHTR